MPDLELKIIKEKLSAQHEGDKKQLEVVFSESPRLIVEAPAGYGKTTTMVSRIAYLFASGCIPNPKRILGLTFSVNAALKIKRDVASKLPFLIGSQNSPVLLGEKANITNYHGFCKGILKKYGYLLSPLLRKDVNCFRAVGENEIVKEQALKTAITTTELQYLKRVDEAIKDAQELNSNTIHSYNDIIIQKLLPLEFVTHNAIIMLVLEILEKFEEIKKFYQHFYALIVVDEFQDTNSIAMALLNNIICEHTQLLFLGDPLQRIYGFIGAVPNIMSKAKEQYGLTKVVLSKNYRFNNNPEMLKLDRNIRLNAASEFLPKIDAKSIALLPGFWGKTQQDEAKQIAEKVQSLMQDKATKIAVLFRSRGKNEELVEGELAKKQISFFYGMFTDEDIDYVQFHNKCLDAFIHRFGKQKNISKKTLVTFAERIRADYATITGRTHESLLRLLDALVEKVAIDYADLPPEDKYTLLVDIFENRQLKQAMEYVDSQVILSTVHGAKGLEWDYVILGDIERWVFPSYYTCSNCPNKFLTYRTPRCVFPTEKTRAFLDLALDELSVFYVGITRAKKQVFVAASAKRIDNYGNEKSSLFSCMVGLSGIKLIKA